MAVFFLGLSSFSSTIRFIISHRGYGYAGNVVGGLGRRQSRPC